MGKKRFFGGIDIGGTKIHSVVASQDGHPIGRGRKKLKGARAPAQVIERACASLGRACKDAGLAPETLQAVGVGAPCAISERGLAVNAPNLGWRDVPLVPQLHEALGVPVVGDNDCNLAALGEYHLGAGRGAHMVVALLMGTGLGGGIVRDGEILAGHHRLAAEFGHMIVQARGRICGCGHAGCLEAYASKTGIAGRLREMIREQKRTSSLADLSDDELANPRSSQLASAFRAHDPVACDALEQAAWYLGIGVANVITLLGPDRVLLGGGVLEALGTELMGAIRSAARDATFPARAYDHTEIELCALGDDAVALGAVVMAQKHT